MKFNSLKTMQLRIYQISHPLVKLVVTRITMQNISKTDIECYYRYIGFLIMYEIMRKYIEVKNLHIQLINKVKNLHVIDKQKQYLILTNTSKTYHMITDIKSLMPNIEIAHVSYDNINTIKDCIQNLNINPKNINIFIIEKTTEDEKIIKLIDYLKNIKEISICNINIANVLSNSIILTKIGEKYPKLKVYTAKINYNTKY
uniref:Uracil phosphoribosyltransferase n=1 Tax=Vertebrata lanosa TaxID=1261582 RepID=A0A0B5W620_9FLOR|nr:uracil phosphoribosyltransferase [Vertebrata lanosa]AJH66061.1 uracil phosphoribosyltransferase [Vertebrata lanosa]